MAKGALHVSTFLRLEVVQEWKEPLPRCNLCGIHMQSGRLIKHQQTERCNRNMQMWWQSRDASIASRCAKASFSLTGDDEAECIEGVGIFKYLGRPLDW